MNEPNSKYTEADMLNGKIWEQFCDRLRDTGLQILRPEVPRSAFDHAEGYRYIARVLRGVLDIFVEHNDPNFPIIYRPCDEIIKYGGDNPDNCYQKCVLDGNRDYLISGKRGTVHYISFLTQGSDYSSGGTMVNTGFLDGRELEIDADGNFEIRVSSTRQPGNWLPMKSETLSLLIRQTFARREQEQLAELDIRCLNPDSETPMPLDPLGFADNLDKASNFLHTVVSMFADWSQRYQAHPNQLPAEDQELCQRVGGDPNIRYYNSYWVLDPDEALVVDLPDIPECENWNLQLCNYWMESLDYRYHRIHVNKFTADYNADGSARIVIAHRDPGLPNWLSTAGHSRGTMLFRWIGASRFPDPQTQVMRLDQLQP